MNPFRIKATRAVQSRGGQPKMFRQSNPSEWWAYSVQSPVNLSNVAGTSGWGFAPSADVKYTHPLGGVVTGIEIQVSGQHNGVWYNCTFTKSPQNSYDWDPSNWTFATAHAQSSGGGSGTMHRAHPGGGLTTLQPGYLGYQPTRMRIRSRP